MNSNAVGECHHSEIASLELGDGRPEAPAIVFLALLAHGMLDDPDAPLAAEVGPLAQDFELEVRAGV